MGDPLKNCVAEICCGELEAQEALAKHMYEEGVCESKGAAARVSEYIYKNYDLAGRGTLKPFKDWVAKHARGADYKP